MLIRLLTGPWRGNRTSESQVTGGPSFTFHALAHDCCCSRRRVILYQSKLVLPTNNLQWLTSPWCPRNLVAMLDATFPVHCCGLVNLRIETPASLRTATATASTASIGVPAPPRRYAWLRLASASTSPPSVSPPAMSVAVALPGRADAALLVR